MKHTKLLIFFVLFTFHFQAKCQNRCNCDTIYDFTDEMPVYKTGNESLLTYLISDIAPAIKKCMKEDAYKISSLRMILTINKKGKVTDDGFLRPELHIICKKELLKTLRKMKGWKAGRLNGQVVCTHFSWPVSCIKWD